MQLQKITFTKVLILSVATYLTVSGRSCEWFRSVRHAVRRMHHHQPMHIMQHNDNRPSLRSRHHSQQQLQDNSKVVTHVVDEVNANEGVVLDQESGLWFSESLELVDDISSNPTQLN